MKHGERQKVAETMKGYAKSTKPAAQRKTEPEVDRVTPHQWVESEVTSGSGAYNNNIITAQ